MSAQSIKSTTYALLGGMLSIVACGGESTTDPSSSGLERVETAATPVQAAAVETWTTGTEALALSTSAGRTIVATSRELLELEGGELVSRAFYVEEDAQPPTSIHTLSARPGGGTWVATDEGLFVLDELYASVLEAGRTLGLTSVKSLHDVGRGPMAGLWLADDAGLHRWAGDRFESLAIAGSEGAFATAVAVTDDGTRALAALSDGLVELEWSNDEIVSIELPFAASTIFGLDAHASSLAAATDAGVFVRSPDTQPSWTHYSLGGQAAYGVAVSSRGSIWARTADALVRIDGDRIEQFGLGASATSASPLDVDARGDVWTGAGDELVRVSPGEATELTSFARDVRPWIETECAACHSNQTRNFLDYDVFSELADSALERVAAGDMPRCDGGRPCAEPEQLTPGEYEVLDLWIRDGKQP